MMKTLFTALSVAAGLMLAFPASAQQQTVVAFDKGESAATVTGSIKGEQDHTYLLDARAGQTLTVTLKSTKGSTEMNVFAPGNDTAISLGSDDPTNLPACCRRTAAIGCRSIRCGRAPGATKPRTTR